MTRAFPWLPAILLLALAPIACAAEFSLWPQLEIAGAYDDNTDRTPTNRKGDFLSVQSPGATLEGSSESRDFFLTYETLLLEQANYSAKDRFFQDNYLDLHDNERLNPGTTLSFDETFLLGNSLGGGIITNDSVPLGTQIMQSLLSDQNTMSSAFAMNLVSRYSNSFSWAGTLNQNAYSVLSGNPASKYNFAQGASIAGDWNVGERLTAGALYAFNDFRFSNASLPTTESNTLAVRLGWGAGTPFTILGQVGPVLSISASGKIGDVSEPSQTSVDLGFLVSGGYTGRRLTVTGTFSQAPGINNGLAGVATTQSYSGLFQYKLTRRTAVFANGGYYATNGTTNSSQVIAYTGGISYLLNRNLSVSMNYVGYRSVANGLDAGELVKVPGKDTVTNLFILSITVHPDSLRWKW